MSLVSRRTAIVAAVLCLQIAMLTFGVTQTQSNELGRTYSFVYLGDIHFDRKSHHDLEWVRANKPNDIRQIEDYVRIAKQFTPRLLKRTQASIESGGDGIDMIIQSGDLTEGLCGSRALQETQFRDVRAFIRQYVPRTPFIAAKGNHDITGPGAREAFDSIMLPWLSDQLGKPIHSASFYFMKGPDLFVFFDAYHDHDLDWLDKTLRENRHRHAFVVMHPPAVPYNARSTWHLFWRERDRDARERFLNILGANHVVLLTGHLHKYCFLVRKTSMGSFVQLSMNSVISSPNVTVKDRREGLDDYGAALVDLEPKFDPGTAPQRRQILEDEKPYVTHFEFADFPGYALLHASDADINVNVYVGDSDKAWKSLSLSSVLGH
jgi:hypothetical protein